MQAASLSTQSAARTRATRKGSNKTSTPTTRQTSTPPPITTSRSRELPGTFTQIKTDADVLKRIREARKLYYLPAPARNSKMREEVFRLWFRECFQKNVPFVAICLRPGPQYGGYLKYRMPPVMAENWKGFSDFSRELGAIYEGLRKNKEAWKNMPGNGEGLMLSLIDGCAPFSDGELRPLLVTWEVLGPMFRGGGTGVGESDRGSVGRGSGKNDDGMNYDRGMQKEIDRMIAELMDEDF